MTRSFTIVILVALASYAPSPSTAQSDARSPASSVIYAELGGYGMILSINYERTIAASPFRLRLGLSPALAGNGIGLSHSRVTLMGSRYFRIGMHGLEAGVGVTASTGDKVLGSRLLATGVFGYFFRAWVFTLWRIAVSPIPPSRSRAGRRLMESNLALYCL